MKNYIHYGHTKFRKDLFTKIKNVDCSTKPRGGLWASDINTKHGWKEWCNENEFRDCNKENSFTFTLSDDAKILYIESVNDLESLPKGKDKFGLNFSSWYLLDFEKLAETYDAVEVSISSDFDLYYKLYGWDCDSIVIMNPDIVVEL